MSKIRNLLRYVSDLHLELRPSLYEPKLVPLWDFHSQYNHSLALIGDIGNPFQKNLEKFLTNVSPKYDKIFYVPGNHEYYNLDKSLSRSKDDYKSKLTMICNKFENVIILDNQTYDLPKIKLIGSTLWSCISKERSDHISTHINDYYLIKKLNSDGELTNITIKDTNAWNKKCIDFITREIKSTSKPCIVMTHHAPLFNGPDYYTAHPCYTNSINNQAFQNDLLYLIKKPIKAWLYGHTHYVNRFVLNNVIIATNQLGYLNETTCSEFNPNNILDLDELTKLN